MNQPAGHFLSLFCALGNVECFRQREEEPWFILKNCGDSERVHVSDCPQKKNAGIGRASNNFINLIRKPDKLSHEF